MLSLGTFHTRAPIRALGTAVMAAHPGLAATLDNHGLTFESVTGEVVELEQFNDVMGKRSEQVW